MDESIQTGKARSEHTGSVCVWAHPEYGVGYELVIWHINHQS